MMIMKYLIIVAVLLSITIIAPAASAQGPAPAEGVPRILSNPLSFIQEKLGINLQSVFPGFKTEMMAPEGVAAGASNLWNNIKTWLQENLGVDMNHFLRGIVGILVWIFEFAIKLFKSALELL